MNGIRDEPPYSGPRMGGYHVADYTSTHSLFRNGGAPSLALVSGTSVAGLITPPGDRRD